MELPPIKDKKKRVFKVNGITLEGVILEAARTIQTSSGIGVELLIKFNPLRATLWGKSEGELQRLLKDIKEKRTMLKFKIAQRKNFYNILSMTKAEEKNEQEQSEGTVENSKSD
jgi:hypothetical protein